MQHKELEDILDFIKHAENLKNTLRYAFTSNGRRESAAEHTWRLCLLLMVCAHLFPHLHLEKMLKIALIHDLAEAVCGDTPAPEQGNHAIKATMERQSLEYILQGLPHRVKNEFMSLWEEYESATTDESKCVKAFDKIETLIQHNQGCNPSDFKYTFNLTYGFEETKQNEVASLLRILIDAETKHILGMKLRLETASK